MDRLAVFRQLCRYFIVTAEMYQHPDRDDERTFRVIEVSRGDLKQLKRLLTLIRDAPPALPPTSMVQKPKPSRSPTHEQLLQFATWMLHARKRRNDLFHPGLFGEAAWDVLLTLYVMDHGPPRVTIAELSRKAGVPTATILRWLQTLEDQGLIARRPHPHDKRAVLIGMEPKGRETMETYLTETLASSA